MANTIDVSIIDDLLGGGSNASGGNSEGARQLIDSLNHVAKTLEGFDGLMGKLIETSKATAGTNQDLKKETLRVRSEYAKNAAGRIENAANPTVQRAAQDRASASLTSAQNKQAGLELFTKYMEKADSHRAAGDERSARRFEERATIALGKGSKEGAKGISGILTGATAVTIATLASRGVGQYFSAQTSIATNAMLNPVANGYNYGNPVAGAFLGEANQQNSMVALGLTAVGAGIGGILGKGKGGALIGGAIGGAAGSIYSSIFGSQANIKSQAIGEYINQRMSNTALLGSNARASGLISQAGVNISSANPRDVFNYQVPVATELAKGAGVYRRNLGAMNALTQYAIAAQVPLAQLGGLGASSAMLKLTEAQVRSGAGWASGAGVGLADLNARTLLFQQGGMSIDSAQRAAANSFGTMSGFQSLQAQNFGGSPMDRLKKNLIASSFGFDYDKALSDVNSPDAKKLKSLTAYGKGKWLNAGLADIFNTTQSTFNPNGTESVAFDANAAMNPSKYQTKILEQMQGNKEAAISGGTINADFSGFVSGISNSTVSLNSFNSSLNDAVATLRQVSTHSARQPAHSSMSSNAGNGSKMGTGPN